MKHFSILLGALLGAFVAGSSAFYVTSAATHGQDYGFVVGVLLLCPMAMCLGAVLGIPVGLRIWRSGLHLRDRKSRRALTLKISGCVAVSFCLIVGLVQGAVSFCIPPSDRELMTNFQQHRSEFE